MNPRFGGRATAAAPAAPTDRKEIPVGYHHLTFLSELRLKSYESDLPIIGGEFRKFSAAVRKRVVDLETAIATSKAILTSGKYPEVLHEGKLIQTDESMWQNAIDADTADIQVWAEIQQMVNELRDNNQRLIIWRINNPEAAAANENKYRATKEANAAVAE